MANGHSALWYARVPYYYITLPPTPHLHRHPTIGAQRSWGHRRCVAVRLADHRPRCHHRHGQHYRRGYSHHPRRPWCRIVVLADGCFRHIDKVCRGRARHQVPREDQERPHARRPHVRLGARSRLEVACRAFRHVYGLCCARNRQHRTVQRYRHLGLRDLPHRPRRHGHRHQPVGRKRPAGRHPQHRPRLQAVCPVHGSFLRVRLLIYSLPQCRLPVAGCQADSPLCLLA